MAPLKNVTFADFWLADQLNSLNTIYSDAVYFTCFYITFYNSKPDGAGNLNCHFVGLYFNFSIFVSS